MLCSDFSYSLATFARILTLRAAGPLSRVPAPADFFLGGAEGEVIDTSLADGLTWTDLRLLLSLGLIIISAVLAETGAGDLNFYLIYSYSASSTTKEICFPGSPVSCRSPLFRFLYLDFSEFFFWP